MISKTIFVSEATSRGGRGGSVRSADGYIDLALDRPKEIGGRGAGTNPEQLFAAGYAACFGGMLEFLMRQRKLASSAVAVTARVAFGEDPRGGYGIGAELLVDIPGLERGQIAELVELAHAQCPYSKATRGNIEVTISVAGGPGL